MKVKILTALLLIAFVACNNDNKKTNTKDRINTEIIAGIEEYDKLLGEQPENAQLLFERALVYYNNKGYQEAIDDLNLAISIDSQKPDYHHLLADCYLDYFNSQKAVTTLENLLVLFPKRTATQLKLSEFHHILKQYDKSVQIASEVLSREPNNAGAYFMMGMNFRAKNDRPKAISSFRASVENDPDQMDAWIILGTLAEEENDPLALDFYNGGLSVQPDNVNLLHAKAFYLQNHSDLNGAQSIYKKIMLIDRKYMEAPLNAGILYLEQDSIQQAYEHFNILVQNKPQEPIGHFYRGFSLEKMNKIESAKADYETALRLNPDYEKAQKALQALEQ